MPQLAGHIAGDLKSLCHRSSLGYKSLNIIRSCQCPYRETVGVGNGFTTCSTSWFNRKNQIEPVVGISGAICLGQWQGEAFQLLEYEAPCSLNAGRFRLPLINTVRLLTEPLWDLLLLIDGPGITRGVAGAELLTGLIEMAAVDTILLMIREGKPAPLMNEMNACGVEVCHVTASPKARSPKPSQRTRVRTKLWDAHLAEMPATRDYRDILCF